jgi:hypothetical protein
MACDSLTRLDMSDSDFMVQASGHQLGQIRNLVGQCALWIEPATTSTMLDGSCRIAPMKDIYPLQVIQMLDKTTMSGKRGLARNIARVGSLDFQVRECLGGTAERYVLLDELLETTITRSEHEATHPILSRKWSETERQALLTFSHRSSELFDLIPWRDAAVSLKDIIERNEAMAEIRNTANECLRQLGVSFTTNDLQGD